MELTPVNTISTISMIVQFIFENGMTDEMNISYFPDSLLNDIRDEINNLISSSPGDDIDIIGSKLSKGFVDSDWAKISDWQYHCKINKAIWNRNATEAGYEYFTTIPSNERFNLYILITIDTIKKI